MVKKEISFKFVEVRHFYLPAGNTAEQSTEDSLICLANGRARNIPKIDGGVDQSYPVHQARGFPDYLAHDPSLRLLSYTDALDFNVLAEAQLAVHYDCRAFAADIYCMPFLKELFSVFPDTRDTNGQG